MKIDYTRRRRAGWDAPAVPSQRVDSPSMPIRLPPAPATKYNPKHKSARKPRRWALLVVPVIAVLALGTAFVTFYVLPGSIENADVGDCASFDRSHPQQPYAVVRCGSQQASLTVLDVLDGNGSCRDVAGATRSTVSTAGNNRYEVCMGPKCADPATAVNVAQVGDCLTGTTGQEKRVPCTDPSARLQILKRLNHVSTTEVSTTCNGVPDATSVYSWTWDSDDGTGPAIASFQTDAVFCLGPIK
jgi:hypothetical protein